MIKINTSSMIDLKVHFQSLDESFISRIKAKVDLDSYLAKLISQSVRYEIWVSKELIGVVCFYHNSEKRLVYVSHLSVLPRYKRQGIGVKLIREIQQRYPGEVIELEVDSVNSNATEFYTKLGFALVQDHGHNLLFRKSGEVNMPREFNDEAVDNSERKYRYEIDALVRRFFLERITSLVTPEESCLEVGSHDGSMTSQLLEIFNHVDVLEPASMFHDSLLSEFGNRITLHPQSIVNAGLEVQFDNIFLVHVLEHLDNPVESLRQISAWLTPNGKLFVMVPNAHALSRQIACEMGLLASVTDVMPGEAMQGHLKTYSMKILVQDVTMAGLGILTTGGVLKKPLANFQLDRALELGLITLDYVKALNSLSILDPQDSSSIYVVASPKGGAIS
jgi:2-polyprenyl-3-methyl-5-hydroxy-6-metoxy-1,4-benzoquinol methylase/GNAT superfamily N-acetyltransferase